MIGLEQRSIGKYVENKARSERKVVQAQAGGSNGTDIYNYWTSQCKIYERRPDVIVVLKGKNLCQILDFPFPYDGRMDTKELEKKTEHYQDLARESRKKWNMKIKVIPLMIDPLGATPIKLRNWLKEIGIETVLLQTARILQKVLEI